MKTWAAWLPLYCSGKVIVKAETEAEAREKILRDAMPPSICHYCSDELEVGEFEEIKDFEVYEENE